MPGTLARRPVAHGRLVGGLRVRSATNTRSHERGAFNVEGHVAIRLPGRGPYGRRGGEMTPEAEEAATAFEERLDSPLRIIIEIVPVSMKPLLDPRND